MYRANTLQAFGSLALPNVQKRRRFIQKRKALRPIECKCQKQEIKRSKREHSSLMIIDRESKCPWT